MVPTTVKRGSNASKAGQRHGLWINSKASQALQKSAKGLNQDGRLELSQRGFVVDMDASTTSLRAAEQDSMTLSSATDEQLIAGYRQTGDRQLFAQLVHRYERELYNFLRRYLGDSTLAEDAFQATFLQVHLKCEQFDEGRRFRPWLYAIATNQAIDARRRVRRQRMVSLDQSSGHESDDVLRLVQVLESTEEDPSSRLERDERNAAVARTLESLPESMMAVVQLVYFQGLKYREAADILNVPVGTVKSRLNSAIGKLTDVWNAHHVETP